MSTAPGTQSSGGSTEITVALVDDHTLVRTGISRLVGSVDGVRVVAEGASIAEGRALVRTHRPAVLVVDVSLPDGSGLDLVEEVRAARNDIGIVVLTMHNDDETLLRALDAGASALVLKSASADEVVDAVRRAAVAPDAFTATGLAMALRRQRTSPKPKLTPRELEVLTMLAGGMSVAGVARRLYMSESTVKTHIAKIYDKLEAHNRAEAVMAAVRLGLVKSGHKVPA